MIPPQLPKNEKQRQAALEKYKILDTLSEESFDNITSLMAYVCDVPISLITLLDKDRNFLKSHHGISLTESPRELSFCGHAINSPLPLTIVEDARKDERFADNPLVTEQHAIFYAGAPLIDSNGFALGTLCVYDIKPRKLTEQQQQAMIAMSKQVVNLFEQRYQNIKLLEFQDKIKKRNQDLEDFVKLVSHDLKSPLSNIVGLTELMEIDFKGKLDAQAQQYLQFLKASSHSLRDYINGLLKFYKSEELLHHEPEELAFNSLMDELIKITDTERKITFHYAKDHGNLWVNKAALLQILINLVTNAIKYNRSREIVIAITFREHEDVYEFDITDNGDGIPTEHADSIFCHSPSTSHPPFVYLNPHSACLRQVSAILSRRISFMRSPALYAKASRKRCLSSRGALKSSLHSCLERTCGKVFFFFTGGMRKAASSLPNTRSQ